MAVEDHFDIQEALSTDSENVGESLGTEALETDDVMEDIPGKLSFSQFHNIVYMIPSESDHVALVGSNRTVDPQS